MRCSLFAFGALLTFCISGLHAGDRPLRQIQDSAGPQVSVGTILVANENLGDPNFTEAVILVVQFDANGGTVGVVINRRSEVPLSRIFPKIKHAGNDPVYMGGPVELTGVQALLRSPEKTTGSTHIVDDVYLTGARQLIEKSISSQADPSKFRLYLGYAGWAPGQLQMEIRIGAWHVQSGTSKIIFDPEPDTLWSRLNREAHMQVASAFAPPRALRLLRGDI